MKNKAPEMKYKLSFDVQAHEWEQFKTLAKEALFGFNGVLSRDGMRDALEKKGTYSGASGGGGMYSIDMKFKKDQTEDNFHEESDKWLAKQEKER